MEEAIEPTDEANMRYQGNYTRRLLDMTDYPEFNIEGMIKISNGSIISTTT